MPTPPFDKDVGEQRISTIEQCLQEGHPPPGVRRGNDKRGAIREAAERLGCDASNQMNWLRAAVRSAGREPDWSLYRPTGKAAPQSKPSVVIGPSGPVESQSRGAAAVDLTALLSKQPMTLDEIAERIGATPGAAYDAVLGLKAQGVNLHQIGDKWGVERSMAPSFVHGAANEYVSRPDNTFLFGVTSDNHLGSKFERLDVLNDLYDRFERVGVDRAFNAGNWIDGEARFNRHELLVHGMDAQCRYLAKNWPRKAFKTYAVAGDDHEGWYAQREGIDVGRYAEQRFQDIGREDWVNLGYMEAHVKLVNANTGAESILALVHPGGGSAYALSYSIQKIIESLDGGEKPAVGIYGHYHKLWAGNIRNVWCLQPGCTEDQTIFMRKKKLEAHVGGAIVRLEQDPETGAIIGFTPTMLRYFNRGFYDGRWSHSGPVTLPERTP